eukprot:TRINITY_DN58195_c0_g1_i1.p1 TRINITY_DN58195_c0_g1~~TRINITY_DN58195_c0_g1_i1.p1  ORF type:complete len:238 (+),score=49.23 TRINITY_DN58195_c0_g1_i1:76-714(+)
MVQQDCPTAKGEGEAAPALASIAPAPSADSSSAVLPSGEASDGTPGCTDKVVVEFGASSSQDQAQQGSPEGHLRDLSIPVACAEGYSLGHRASSLEASGCSDRRGSGSSTNSQQDGCFCCSSTFIMRFKRAYLRFTKEFLLSLSFAVVGACLLLAGITCLVQCDPHTHGIIFCIVGGLGFLPGAYGQFVFIQYARAVAGYDPEDLHTNFHRI